MILEKYERTEIKITEFDAEDIITTSSNMNLEEYEHFIPSSSLVELPGSFY